jgi:hypothetical protein
MFFFNRKKFRDAGPKALDNGTGSGGNTGPQISTFLGDGTGDSGTLHFTLGVNNDTSVILKVKENTVSAAPGLTLTDDNTSHN